MFFVDTSNAFDRLNRKVAFRNSKVICPALAPILINTYRRASHLFVDGQCMMSREGTTQGDPLAMAMYAIATQSLIRRLNNIIKQVQCADDFAAGANLESLKRWWDLLKEIGPHYGYYLNSSKTYIFAKQDVADTAREIFQGTGINISTQRTFGQLQGQ